MAARSATAGGARRAPAKHKSQPKPARSRRRPIWAEADASARARAGRERRLAVVYDIDGPRVRLGILWFAVELVAVLAGVAGIALLFGLTAGVAALQTARCWRREGAHPDRFVAGGGAVAVTLAATVTTGLVGLAIIGVAAAAVVVARRTIDPRRADPVNSAGFTVRCAVPVAFAAACVVVGARFSLGATVALLLLAAAYETGDYLIGSGAANPYEGPIAGATAMLVVAFAVTALGIKPLAFPSSFVLFAVAAVLCPAGQLFASALLPAAGAPASALRRLDSLLLLAPAWALAIGWLI